MFLVPQQCTRIRKQTNMYFSLPEACLTYFMRSSSDIQKMPSSAPRGINVSLTVPGRSCHRGDWSDQSPFHEKRPQGFRNRTSLKCITCNLSFLSRQIHSESLINGLANAIATFAEDIVTALSVTFVHSPVTLYTLYVQYGIRMPGTQP